MSYKQNNPFSRKSSPLNDFDDLVTKLEGQGESHESAVKIAGSVANAKMHGAGSGPTAKQKARHGMSRRPKEKPSTKPVEETRMTKGDQMPSRESSNETGVHDTNESFAAAVAAESAKPAHDPFSGDFAPDVSFEEKVRRESMMEESDPFDERGGGKKMGPRRKSSSPLNNTGMTGLNYSKELQYMPIEDDMHRGMSRQPYGGNKGDEKRSVKDYEGPSRKSSSPVKHTMTTKDGTWIHTHTPANEGTRSKGIKVTGKKAGGTSRKSSSPLDFGSWAHHDAVEAGIDYGKGDYAHARALGIDEHDADYGKWKSSEAEHGPSRKSRSERLRERAVKLSEKGGEGQGGIDYENPKVVKLMRKARELDERSGEKIAKDQERILRKGKWGS